MRVKVANWRNCLLDVSKCSLKIVLRCSNDLCLIPFVTSWKLFRSHAVTPRWLDDCKECIQSGWNKQRDCRSLAHKIPAKDAAGFRKLHFSKIICRLALGLLMNLLLNGTRKSISLSVYLMFDLEAGWFKFLGENLLGDRKWHFHPCLLCSKQSTQDPPDRSNSPF